MALNFPASPNTNDTYTEGGTTWQFDGTSWNIIPADTERSIFTTFIGDTGSASADVKDDTLIIQGGNNVTTSISNKTITIDATSTGLTQNLFETITSDDGSAVASTTTDTLSISGGTNISTAIATDTKELVINLNSFPIGFLSNVSDTTPTSGQVLKWDGSQWAPGTDIASGGTGLDADTLDGFDSTYYLDYNNFTNTPTVATLSDFSVGNELTPSGNGAINYDNTTGIFRYTPPTAAGIGALTSVAFSDLTSTPTTIAGYGITDALQLGTTSTTALAGDTAIPSTLTDLGINDGTSGQVLTTDGSGNFTFTTVTAGGSGATNFLELSDTPSSFGTAGQIVAVNGTGDGLIFTDDQTGTGEANQNAFSSIIVSGQNSIFADTTTDSFTLTAGANISITTDSGTSTITIANTASSGASDFDQLGDATTASLTIDKIYEPAIAMIRMDNVGTTAYTAPSHYSGNNPTIYALAGTTIAFDLDAIPGHPFEIQDPTSNPYNTGLVHVSSTGTVSTGSNAQGKDSGTLYWRIPESIGGTYRYQCTIHAGMVGAITVKRLSVI